MSNSPSSEGCSHRKSSMGNNGSSTSSADSRLMDYFGSPRQVMDRLLLNQQTEVSEPMNVETMLITRRKNNMVPLCNATTGMLANKSAAKCICNGDRSRYKLLGWPPKYYRCTYSRSSCSNAYSRHNESERDHFLHIITLVTERNNEARKDMEVKERPTLHNDVGVDFKKISLHKFLIRT